MLLGQGRAAPPRSTHSSLNTAHGQHAYVSVILTLFGVIPQFITDVFLPSLAAFTINLPLIISLQSITGQHSPCVCRHTAAPYSPTSVMKDVTEAIITILSLQLKFRQRVFRESWTLLCWKAISQHNHLPAYAGLAAALSAPASSCPKVGWVEVHTVQSAQGRKPRAVCTPRRGQECFPTTHSLVEARAVYICMFVRCKVMGGVGSGIC